MKKKTAWVRIPLENIRNIYKTKSLFFENKQILIFKFFPQIFQIFKLNKKISSQANTFGFLRRS
jgi:hypothetical protein